MTPTNVPTRPTTPVTPWFWPWLRRHRQLLPHQGWAQYTGETLPLSEQERSEYQLEIFEGWMRDFECYGITERAAIWASRRLQAHHPGWPEHHLEAIVREAVLFVEHERRQEEQRRKAEERAQAEAVLAQREELRAIWQDLDENERYRIQAEVEAANPALARFPGFVRSLCLDALAEELAQVEAQPTRKTTRRRPVAVG